MFNLNRVVNIGSGIGTDSIADSDTQYRISIGGTFKKRVPEGYRGGIDRYSDTDTSSVIIVCHYSLSYNQKMTSRMFVCETFFKYRGPASKSGNSLFQCMKCPPNVLNKEGKEALLSCSVLNIYKYIYTLDEYLS